MRLYGNHVMTTMSVNYTENPLTQAKALQSVFDAGNTPPMEQIETLIETLLQDKTTLRRVTSTVTADFFISLGNALLHRRQDSTHNNDSRVKRRTQRRDA